MMISNKTLVTLKNAGWYEGRTIDITDRVKFLEEKGFEVIDSAKRFMEEFGDLKIKVERTRQDGTIRIVSHDTCIEEVVGIGDSSFFDISEYIDEKFTLIGAIFDANLYLYISESGKIFDSMGWDGDNIWEAWENIINEKITLPWDKYNKIIDDNIENVCR